MRHMHKIKSIVLTLTLSLALALVICSNAAWAQFFNIEKSVPGEGSRDVPVDTPIIVHFNYSLNTISVPRDILYEGSTHRAVPVDVRFEDEDETLLIVPKAPLKPGTFYVINLIGIHSVASALLNPMRNRVSFTTKGGRLSVVTYVTPNELTLPPGGYQDVVYSFIEAGGGLGEILKCTLVYEDSGGRQLSSNTENMNLVLRGSQTTKFRSTVAIPQDVGSFALGQTITVRRIFAGLDHESNKFEFRTGVKVNILNPQAPAGRIAEVLLKIPQPGMMIPKDSIISAEGLIKGSGSGDIHGSWNFDGKPLSFFVQKMTNSETVKVTTQDKVLAQTEGKHTLSIQLISPEKKSSEEVIYLVSSAPSAIPIPLKPLQGAVFSGIASTAPTFQWSQNPSAVAYKVAISRTKDFKSTDWIRIESNTWTPDWVKWSGLGSGIFYWAIKPILFNNQEGPSSEVCTFTINK
ncbi:MAG: Ig-like domain-containing protein [Candidatus Xenobiia bacterium LiM19]